MKKDTFETVINLKLMPIVIDDRFGEKGYAT